MKTRTGQVLSLLLALLLVMPAGSVFAQDEAPAPEVAAFTQAELDQMLAPIALYPDTLLSQILMASTYPLEVVQAARWSKANPGLQGEAAVRAVDDRDWDPSVKSLVAFPQVLSMMDEKIDWTEKLGDAFLAQQGQVMDTVQGLRRKADAAGNLKSGENYQVETQDKIIVVTSPNPQVVYVPYYDPLVVYGPWWWPAYRPVYWAPWPGYYARPGVVFHWSVGISVGHGFFFGACDWPRRYIKVVDARPFYYHRVHRPLPVRHVWVHNYEHRRGVPYRSPAVQKKYVHVNTPPVKRHDYGDRIRDAQDPRDRRDGNRPDRRRDAGIRDGRGGDGRGDGRRDGRGVTRETDRRVWSGSGNYIPPPNDGGAYDRARIPTKRPDLQRPEARVPSARPDPAQRPVVRGDGQRVREQRPGNDRARVAAQERAPTVVNVPASSSSVRNAPRRGGEERGRLSTQSNLERDLGRQVGQQRALDQPGAQPRSDNSANRGRGELRHSNFAERR